MAEQHSPDLILSCGDWGYAITISEFESLLEIAPVLSIYGNHENFMTLKSIKNLDKNITNSKYIDNSNNFKNILIKESIIYEFGKLRIAGINGIVSLKLKEKEGVPRKNPKQFINSAYNFKNKNIDILLIHETPYLPFLFHRIDKSPGATSALNSIKIIKPKLVLNGHMHGKCFNYYQFDWNTKYLKVDSSQANKCYAIIQINNIRKALSEIIVYKDDNVKFKFNIMF